MEISCVITNFAGRKGHALFNTQDVYPMEIQTISKRNALKHQ